MRYNLYVYIKGGDAIMGKQIKYISLIALTLLVVNGYIFIIIYLQSVVKPNLKDKYGNQTFERCQYTTPNYFMISKAKKKCVNIQKADNEYNLIFLLCTTGYLSMWCLITYYIYRKERFLLR